jgi:NAD(P)-dependent dehydrogenase (short-subunit alcohol dehydrogenase family)
MSERIDFAGRVVIVTGAGNGLGRRYALDLGARGAAVVVNDAGVASDGTNGDTRVADTVVEEIRANGGYAVASVQSVATTEGAQAIVETARHHFGRVDALVNNAGILRDAAFEDISDEDFRAVVDTHLRGAFGVTRAALPLMKKAGYGRVVFTSSGAALFGRGWQASYTAAKAGMIGLSNALAIEGAGYGIKSNVVLPVATTRLAEAARPEAATGDALLERPEMTTIFNRLTPEFVAPLVLYLASCECSVTQRTYSSVAGRYARVMFAVTSGWRSPGDEPPTPEAVARHFAQIEDPSEYDTPSSVVEEMYFAAVRAAAPHSPPVVGIRGGTYDPDL